MINIALHNEITLIATQHNALAAVWLGPPSVELLKQVKKAGITLAGTYPQGTLFLNIMLRGKARFSAEARAEAAQQTTENAIRAKAGAHIVAAEGLIAATARAFISTILLLSRPTRPTKVFGTIQEAAPWLVELAPPGEPGWTTAKLVAFYDEIVAKA